MRVINIPSYSSTRVRIKSRYAGAYVRQEQRAQIGVKFNQLKSIKCERESEIIITLEINSFWYLIDVIYLLYDLSVTIYHICILIYLFIICRCFYLTKVFFICSEFQCSWNTLKCQRLLPLSFLSLTKQIQNYKCNVF